MNLEIEGRVGMQYLYGVLSIYTPRYLRADAETEDIQCAPICYSVKH